MNLGGRDLDRAILEKVLRPKLDEEGLNGQHVITKAKARLTALEGIVEARLALSEDDTATAGFLNLVDNEDYDFEITLEEFEECIKPMKKRLEQLID